MAVKLIPHGWTVLVEPDLPPEKTDSGSIILPEDHFFIPTSGTVVAVGKGSKRLWEERQKVYRRIIEFLGRPELDDEGESRVREFVQRLANAPDPTPSVHAGERVVFAAQAGLTIKDEDGKDYILLDEDRIAIIVEEEAVA